MSTTCNSNTPATSNSNTPATSFVIPPPPNRPPPSGPTTPTTSSMPGTPATDDMDPRSKTAMMQRLEHAALWTRLHRLAAHRNANADADTATDAAARERKWAVALCSLAEVAHLVTPEVVRDTLLPFARSVEEAVDILGVVDALCAPALVGAGGWI